MRPGMYIVVSDLGRSAELYQEILQREPIVQLPDLIGFDIRGCLFALFAESAFTRDLVRGNNTVPYFQVDDLDGEFERIGGLPVRMLDERIVDEGPIRLFMFADADGNAIELFALSATASTQM